MAYLLLGPYYETGDRNVISDSESWLRRTRNVSNKITAGIRTTYHENGKTLFDWQKPNPSATVSGSWANVDSRLGIVVIEGSGITYTQAKSYTSGISVYTDTLNASYSEQSRHFNSGEMVARRVVLLLTETSPEQTAALAQSLRIEKGGPEKVLHFSLPEGGQARLSLQ